jgi:hypothetical protein
MGRFSPAAVSFSMRGNWRKRSFEEDALFRIEILFTTVFHAPTRAGWREQLKDSDKCGGVKIQRDITANTIENSRNRRTGFRIDGTRRESDEAGLP